MNNNLILYIASSQDDFISGESDDLSFLKLVEIEGEDYGYLKFINSVEAILVGRKTYDKVISMGFPYHENKNVYVISRDVKKGGRSNKYEQTIEWLQKAGLVNIAYNVSVPNLPLSAFSDISKFKLYLFDNGLLGAMLNISSSIIIDVKNTLFEQFNGAFVENFVASELVAYNDEKLFYWTSNSDAEVDFLIQRNNKVFPIEVKSGMSRNTKSLTSYTTKYTPELTYRVSPRNFHQSDKFINIPLYLVSYLR